MARGGKREGAGRPSGAKTKTGQELREAAQAFTADALMALAEIMRDSDSDAARVTAANSILDRGYGKPTQQLDVDADVRGEVSLIQLIGVRPGDNRQD